jgi:hypothetical protein
MPQRPKSRDQKPFFFGFAGAALRPRGDSMRARVGESQISGGAAFATLVGLMGAAAFFGGVAFFMAARRESAVFFAAMPAVVVGSSNSRT